MFIIAALLIELLEDSEDSIENYNKRFNEFKENIEKGNFLLSNSNFFI